LRFEPTSFGKNAAWPLGQGKVLVLNDYGVELENCRTA
jgi:hypothetical protein